MLLLLIYYNLLLQVLLEYHADVNDTFAGLQTTALMTSSFHGHADVVRVLLDHGASPKTVDVQGSTALGYCFGGTFLFSTLAMLIT